MNKDRAQPSISLILDFFNSEILAGAQAYVTAEGLRLDARWSVRGDWSPKRLPSDGVIYGVVDHAPLEARIAECSLPKVSLCREENEVPQILPDYVACGTLAAKEAIANGATLILNFKSNQRAIDQDFANGVSSFATKSGVECRLIECDLDDFEKKCDWIVSRIQASPLPATLCNPHAGLTYTLQGLLAERAIRVPEDVSMIVIEKDVQQTSSLAPVPLTTIELDEWHRGYLAAEMVNRLILKEALPQKRILLPPKGVTRRASTGYPEIDDQVVAKVLKFLRQNHLKRIGVSDIAEQVGFSRRVIEKRFREVLNRGVHEELNRLRLEEAKRKINLGEESITTIAESCGFSSVHYFSSAFKRAEGLSPKTYQNQNHENPPHSGAKS